MSNVQPISSLSLSFLSFALSSWLDGSAQLRRSLSLLPLEVERATNDVHETELRAPTSSSSSGTSRRARLAEYAYSLFRKPSDELSESGKAAVGLFDVSVSILVLKFLGTGPLLPFLLNPLTVVLPLPRSLTVGSVKWSQVVLTTFLLSTLHETQRACVSAGLTHWKRRKLKKDLNPEELSIRGQELRESFDDDDEVCVICSGVGIDTSLSDSVSSLPPSSSTPGSSLGPLEEFCVNAPRKHPMHRACFLAWKNAYWEERSRNVQPVITLLCEDESIPSPGTRHWLRTQAILSVFRATQNAIYALAHSSHLPSNWREGNLVDESVFTLFIENEESERSFSEGKEVVLGDMVTTWPSCPGCRSAVKMIFTRTLRDSSQNPEKELKGIRLFLRTWLCAWRRLVTGRTILIKTATRLLFAVFLVSMLKIRRSRGRQLLLTTFP